MRQNSTTTINPVVKNIASYHDHVYGERYEASGFEKLRLFTSDRTIGLTPDYKRVDDASKSLKSWGLEIELVSNGSVRNKKILATFLQCHVFPTCGFPADFFKLQNDSSLRGSDGGATGEAITQTFTKAFLRNNYRSFKAMYDGCFPEFGLLCNSSCGMHVNIDNSNFGATKTSQDEAIKKLLYFINKNYNLCCSLFRRSGDFTFCSRMNGFASKDACKNVDLSAYGSDHYICFNLGHYNQGRIEVRLVGGQANYAAFRNTMETVFFLVDRVKKISWSDLDDLARVFDGCNQYVVSRLKLANEESRLESYVLATIAANSINEGGIL